MSTPTTRKHPRTLEEAFGPYERGPVVDIRDPDHRIGILCAIGIVLVLALVGVLG
jgi:hypothetical protein